MSAVVNIPALFEAISLKVNAVLSARATDPFSVWFDYGRYMEITRRLTEKGQGQEQRSKRFPLIWLVIPFEEDYGSTSQVCDLKNLQIILAALTEVDSTTPDRMADNFIPRLYPIYTELIRQIKLSGFFSEIGYDVPHKKIDQPYWGGEDGKQQANFFDQPIDAIQLKNIRLTVNETTCEKFQLIKGTSRNILN